MLNTNERRCADLACNGTCTLSVGVDRHFFGLSKMLKEGEDSPDLFQDPVFDRSKHWRLSTSNLPTCPGFGFVVDDG